MRSLVEPNGTAMGVYSPLVLLEKTLRRLRREREALDAAPLADRLEKGILDTQLARVEAWLEIGSDRAR